MQRHSVHIHWTHRTDWKSQTYWTQLIYCTQQTYVTHSTMSPRHIGHYVTSIHSGYMTHYIICHYDTGLYVAMTLNLMPLDFLSLGHMLAIMEWIHFYSCLYLKTLKKSFCNLIWTILPYENIKFQFWKSWGNLDWGPTLHCDRAKNKKERTLLLSNEKEQHYCFKGNCISCFWKKVELHDHNFHNKMSKSHCTDE